MPGESMVMLAGSLPVRIFSTFACLSGWSRSRQFWVTASAMNSALARTRLVAATRTEFLASTERLDRMDAFFARHGGWSVFFAHFFMSAGR